MNVEETALKFGIPISKVIGILSENNIYKYTSDILTLDDIRFVEKQLLIEKKELKENSIEYVFEKSISSEEIFGLSVDFSEIGLDNFLDEGLLQDIPIFGTMARAVKIGKNVGDKIFAKKVYKFFFELKNVSQKDREDFIKKINNDSKYETRVGEQMISILNRLDDYTKASMMGRLLKSCLEGKIDYDTFLRLTFFLSKLFSPDIDLLKKMTLGQNLSQVQYESLLNTGLIKSDIIDKRVGPVSQFSGRAKTKTALGYQINEFGRLLVRYALPER